MTFPHVGTRTAAHGGTENSGCLLIRVHDIQYFLQVGYLDHLGLAPGGGFTAWIFLGELHWSYLMNPWHPRLLLSQSGSRTGL